MKMSQVNCISLSLLVRQLLISCQHPTAHEETPRCVRGGGVEEWRGGGVEEWRSGGVEEWRSGEVEEWRGGGVKKTHRSLGRLSALHHLTLVGMKAFVVEGIYHEKH